MPNKQRIIVADDEPVIANTLVTILNQDGFEARAAYSGEEALQIASTFAPDMLISDVIMGELNGIETAILMRTFLPEIKILLFSGHSFSADLLKQANAQGHQFEILAKPIHPKDLLIRLRSDTMPAITPHTSDEQATTLHFRSGEPEQRCN